MIRRAVVWYCHVGRAWEVTLINTATGYQGWNSVFMAVSLKLLEDIVTRASKFLHLFILPGFITVLLFCTSRFIMPLFFLICLLFVLKPSHHPPLGSEINIIVNFKET